MAAAKDKVMAMVERTLKKAPDTPSAVLQEKAAKLNPEVGKLSVRQFHAKYPLQVKRKLGAGKRKKSKPTRKPKAQRGRRGARITRAAVPGAGLTSLARTRLDDMLEDFVSTVRSDFDRATKKGSLESVDAELARIAKLRERWKRGR